MQKTMVEREMTRQKGFSLVELAIALVIIGLLIGGILAGQSMRNTAQIQGVIRQLSQYDAALSNFQTKYNQLPGDANVIAGSSWPYVGNNDGQITYFETPNVWQVLSLGVGLKNYQGNNFATWTTPYTQSSCPQFNIDQNSAISPCLVAYYQTVGSNPGKNYYMYFAPLNQLWGNAAPNDVLKAITLASIDQKIDDGLPSSGKVLGIKGSYAPNYTNNLCVINNAYNISSTTYNCEMLVELGFTGNSQ